MERYTVNPPSGITSVGSVYGVIQDVIDKPNELFKLFDKLGAYEDTGLMPENIEMFKNRSTPLKVEEIYVDKYICPVCGIENNCDHGIFHDKYCPKCGQAIYQGNKEAMGKIENLAERKERTMNNQIENNFTYHSPKGEQKEKYEAIRAKSKELAYLIDEACPGSREKSLAMTKLEESIMWAHASIARNWDLKEE